MTATAHPRLEQVLCADARGLHRMAYWEWGDARNPHVVVCVHGLSRQGRDFDTLAADLASDCRVICPDVVGRGQSDWLSDPAAYALPTYVADMVTLLARLAVPQVDWVGTSMGGLIGLSLASLPVSGAGPGASALAPVRRLVLNDIGPTLDAAGLQRIGAYIGQPAHWPDLDTAAAALWSVSQGFGPHTREQWLALTRPQLRADGSGYSNHYDPAIGINVRAVTPAAAAAGQALLWQAYGRVTAPTLLLRGAQSDLLTAATAQAMTETGPRAQLRVFDGVGHAPTLVAADQREAVRLFLLSR